MQAFEETCRKIRINILKMLEKAGSGHTGGSLSCVEILVALYFYQMKPEDIFVLSKGHAAPALYAVLAEKGLIPEEELKTLRQFGSRLQGHTSSLHLPDIIFSAGALGQGLSFTNGLALAAKLNNNSRRHYVLLSDAEMQYGQIWSAAQTASHWGLDNVCAIVDYNKWQIDGRVNEIKTIEPLAEKWKSFGWLVYEVAGHSLLGLRALLRDSKIGSNFNRLPAVIIAHTKKGKGVSFIENNNKFHGQVPNKEELVRALQELEGGNDCS